MTTALERQGDACHWLNPFAELRTRCGSLVGSSTLDRDAVTCVRCLDGRRAEDVVTGPYGSTDAAQGGGQRSLFA